MPDALPDERWAGIRALCEGQPPTHERVAMACGVGPKSIAKRAGQEGWKTLDFRFKRVRGAWNQAMELAARAGAGEELDREMEPIPDEPFEMAPAEVFDPDEEDDPEGRIERIGAMLSFRAEAMLKSAVAGRPLEARQVAALSAMVQLSDRLAAIAREHAQKRQVRSDEELAEAFRLIDERIIYMARCEARRLLTDVFGIAQAEVDAKVPDPDAEPEPEGR
ncbi:hypothetical protein [Aquibium oceanicum]|uniref:Uncharacterized protein n=1 Tax=Aquibium oceanicum TaxID=1670800 RepID=A0A1L3SPE8_9HYPH|nr:hypothetical protein [Aquibium oceanicum]APH71250.1 hypothetical protein BSQ44_07575 [Aquibium oceanicum]